MRHKRTYTFLVDEGGKRGYAFWPSRECTSNLRIRAVAAILFGKWFGGRKSKFSWGKDGFMAEVQGHNGICIQVEQTNHYSRYRPGATQMRSPLCPMVIKKEVQS